MGRPNSPPPELLEGEVTPAQHACKSHGRAKGLARIGYNAKLAIVASFTPCQGPSHRHLPRSAVPRSQFLHKNIGLIRQSMKLDSKQHSRKSLLQVCRHLHTPGFNGQENHHKPFVFNLIRLFQFGSLSARKGLAFLRDSGYLTSLRGRRQQLRHF